MAQAFVPVPPRQEFLKLILFSVSWRLTDERKGAFNLLKQKYTVFYCTVLARASRPGWLSWQVCKSGRG